MPRFGMLVVASLLLSACDLVGQSDPPAPPPTVPIASQPGVPPQLGAPNKPGVQPNTVPTIPVQAGLQQVVVTASSTPEGATVTGGGRELGATPLSTQVPIPTPAPGQPPPVFDFTFTLDGYQTATLQASPANGQINITAALAPAGAQGTAPAAGEGGGGEGAGRTLDITGRGGGQITDNHTTTARAQVDEECIVDRMSVTLRGHHSYHSDLTVTLRSPTGQSYTLQRQRSRDPFRTYRVRSVAGKQAQGRWAVSVRDTVPQDSGNLTGIALRIACR